MQTKTQKTMVALTPAVGLNANSGNCQPYPTLKFYAPSYGNIRHAAALMVDSTMTAMTTICIA